ncbi:MAG: hypothetical protein FJ125_15590, partial [Deltaproteobacteria bacterium]|nr:hypothetical protein [Deltaproteobacteria bacterium]
MKIMLLGSALLAALLAAAGLGCSREAPEKEEISKEPSCRIDTDCPEKQACEQGVCRSQAPECRDDGECPRGFACTDWQCRPWQGPCTSDQGCPADSQCSEGSCRPFVCSADLDCGEGGWICGGGICKAGCQSDEERT